MTLYGDEPDERVFDIESDQKLISSRASLTSWILRSWFSGSPDSAIRKQLVNYLSLLPRLWKQWDPNTLCPPWYKAWYGRGDHRRKFEREVVKLHEVSMDGGIRIMNHHHKLISLLEVFFFGGGCGGLQTAIHRALRLGRDRTSLAGVPTWESPSIM